MPTILDSLFHKVDNTTSSPEGWVVGGAMKSRDLLIQNFLYGQMASIQAVFRSQNVVTSMPSLTSQSCGDSLQAVCLAGKVGAIYRPSEHLWMPDRSVYEASLKVDG